MLAKTFVNVVSSNFMKQTTKETLISGNSEREKKERQDRKRNTERKGNVKARMDDVRKGRRNDGWLYL
jgi:hypothetical protein